jgi:hypothetical protein
VAHSTLTETHHIRPLWTLRSPLAPSDEVLHHVGPTTTVTVGHRNRGMRVQWATVPERWLADIDRTTPSAARVYDYFLGGKDNFACDRQVADELVRIAPEMPAMAKANRAFLVRAVRFMAEQGITQFLDIGTGLPTQNNVHQIVQAIVPDARVAYVDNDPLVLVHARALLADNPQTIVVDADLRQPDSLLADPDLRRVIDFDQPLAVNLVGILYFLTEEDQPFDVVRRLRDAMAPGSYLALSHVVSDDRLIELTQATALYRTALNREGSGLRTREQVTSFFDGLDLVEPGLVHTQDWRPDADTPLNADVPKWILGGVARKN